MTRTRGGKSLRQLRARHSLLPGLILLALAVHVTGLVLPVARYERLFRSERAYSVVGGVINLAQSGTYGLALLILVFSVLFPVAKLFTLLVLWYRPAPAQRRERILYWLKLLGKWSLLDVFVVVITAGVLQLGMLASAEVRPGMYVFCAGLLLSMAATFLMDRAARARPAA